MRNPGLREVDFFQSEFVGGRAVIKSRYWSCSLSQMPHKLIVMGPKKTHFKAQSSFRARSVRGVLQFWTTRLKRNNMPIQCVEREHTSNTRTKPKLADPDNEPCKPAASDSHTSLTFSLPYGVMIPSHFHILWWHCVQKFWLSLCSSMPFGSL